MPKVSRQMHAHPPENIGNSGQHHANFDYVEKSNRRLPGSKEAEIEAVWRYSSSGRKRYLGQRRPSCLPTTNITQGTTMSHVQFPYGTTVLPFYRPCTRHGLCKRDNGAFIWYLSPFHGSVASGRYIPGDTNLRYNYSASDDDIVTCPREHR
jgi:hypothetical protein